ncbi:hypothetical protein BAB79_14770 [Mycobacteroides abscessus]|nr:hypothetical protein BAB79_14770 [Mycobacteroides abscessus]
MLARPGRGVGQAGEHGLDPIGEVPWTPHGVAAGIFKPLESVDVGAQQRDSCVEQTGHRGNRCC